MHSNIYTINLMLITPDIVEPDIVFTVNYPAKIFPKNLWDPMMQGVVCVWQNLNTIPMYMANNGMI